ALSTSLPTCQTLPIIAKSFDVTTNATNGTPPFYMISLEVKGTPQTTFIGEDGNNLSWTVTHAPGGPHSLERSVPFAERAFYLGAQLILQVVDANGSAGGIPPRIFNVVAGQTTQCVITPRLNPSFTVSANVSSDGKLDNCQPWGLTIKGGVPPYNLTLVQPNSPITTNVTIPLGDDAFTYINRATPNSQLLGKCLYFSAISDLSVSLSINRSPNLLLISTLIYRTGRWATGTPIVNTVGSDPDPACPGLNSSSGNSTIIKQEADAVAAASRAANRQRATAIAVSLVLIFLALVCIAVAVYVLRIKRRQRQELEKEERKPRQYVLDPEPDKPNGDLEAGPAVILSITRFLDADSPIAGTPQNMRQSKQPPWRSPAKNTIISPTDTVGTGTTFSYVPASNEADNGDAARPSSRVLQLSMPQPKPHTRSSSFSKFPTRPIRVPSSIAAAGLAPVREAQTPMSTSGTIREPPPPPYVPVPASQPAGRRYSR
ncbi:hypothetical protein CVT24_013000, partial [Panaeolus cyanescens]